MTKAYDKVQFDILLDKLYKIGVRGETHRWFKSYLKNREQYVEIEHFDYDLKQIVKVRSNKKIINASIPQGSVIGCLLFLIYINDLPKALEEPSVLFADDVSVLTSCQDDSDINNQLTSIFNTTIKWMDQHNLEINYRKTKIMTFYPYQKNPLAVNFTINGTKIEVVKDFTLLGITIDTHITWKTHINNPKAKISKFSYALREVKKTTDIQTALTMYYAYANAWLSYGIILWGNSTVSMYQLRRTFTHTTSHPHCQETRRCHAMVMRMVRVTLETTGLSCAIMISGGGTLLLSLDMLILDRSWLVLVALLADQSVGRVRL